MRWILILELLVLLTLANGTPVIAKRLLGKFLDQPLDGGITFLDGQPLLGPSKSVRGIVLSILITTALAPAVGLEWKIGLVVSSMAMAGDLFSSFVKRRLRYPPSTRATGLDQIPESLFPTLACRTLLELTAFEISMVVAVFFVGEIVLSKLLFELHVRDRPF
jgi:CDP-2,3-bis-(O-geranylgeranyl)-sn-glycerol synthase